MSPSKAKGANFVKRREGIEGNRKVVRGRVVLLRVAVCLKEGKATHEGLVAAAAEEEEERGGRIPGRRMGVLKTVAILERKMKIEERKIRGGK